MVFWINFKLNIHVSLEFKIKMRALSAYNSAYVFARSTSLRSGFWVALCSKRKQLKNQTQLTAVNFMILGLIFPLKSFMVLCGQLHISATLSRNWQPEIVSVIKRADIVISLKNKTFKKALYIMIMIEKI